MTRQCPCGFATDDQLWLESHQARHLLDGDQQAAPMPARADYDLSALPVDELERTRRQLEASLALARPGSVISVPIMAQIRAIDAALLGTGTNG
jgi:hypothetical protein